MDEATVPIRDYVDMRFADLEKYTQLAMSNGNAYIAQFQQLRDEVATAKAEVDERLTRMEERQHTTARNLTWAVALIGFIFTVINFVRGNPF